MHLQARLPVDASGTVTFQDNGLTLQDPGRLAASRLATAMRYCLSNSAYAELPDSVKFTSGDFSISGMVLSPQRTIAPSPVHLHAG